MRGNNWALKKIYADVLQSLQSYGAIAIAPFVMGLAAFYL